VLLDERLDLRQPALEDEVAVMRNVLRQLEGIFRQRVPRCSRSSLSEVGPNRQSMTSAMSHSAAVRTEFIRFSAASEEGRSDDRWLPTSTSPD
jgi:hypothetical protein